MRFQIQLPSSKSRRNARVIAGCGCGAVRKEFRGLDGCAKAVVAFSRRNERNNEIKIGDMLDISQSLRYCLEVKVPTKLYAVFSYLFTKVIGLSLVKFLFTERILSFFYFLTTS